MILAAIGMGIMSAGGSMTAAPRLQTEDCVAAVVDARVITSFDLRVIKRFGLFGRPLGDESWKGVCESLISQKIIIDSSQPPQAVDPEEIAAAEKETELKMGPQEYRKTLDEFGMETRDLYGYLEEMLLCRKIIQMRFSQSPPVTLKEVEDYYQDVYVPSQKKAGLEPLSMIQAFDRIEAGIKEEKQEKQIAAWIETLKTQANIQINEDCLE